MAKVWRKKSISLRSKKPGWEDIYWKAKSVSNNNYSSETIVERNKMIEMPDYLTI